jgi:hypothetical protein
MGSGLIDKQMEKMVLSIMAFKLCLALQIQYLSDMTQTEIILVIQMLQKIL